MFKKRIDFLVIGAQKCGTSSLVEYLRRHPQIGFASKKELHFFNFKWDKGQKWYHSFFQFSKHRLQGEATPYYMVDPMAPKRAHTYNPKLKLIAILRHPTERAYSHYRMNMAKNWETKSFMEALQAEEDRLGAEEAPHTVHAATQHASYKQRGLYAAQLNRWTQYFDKEQLLVLNYHQFFEDPAQALQEVFNFLELAPFYPFPSALKLNAQSEESKLPIEAENYLNAYFSEANAALAKTYGIHF